MDYQDSVADFGTRITANEVCLIIAETKAEQLDSTRLLLDICQSQSAQKKTAQSQSLNR